MNSRVLAIIAFALSASAWGDDGTSAGASAQPTQEQVVAQFRNDLQAASADVMAKGLTLTADQASKFWPLFQAYQKEQSEIVDGQLKATQDYAQRYTKLTDAEALEYVNALLARDQKVHDLRIKWLAKFQTVVPPRVAARAVQLERRLGLVTQIKLSSKIPLVQ
ncbi:MAG: hypothetical protein ACJ8OJ_08545 [Povalibacter sp.]